MIFVTVGSQKFQFNRLLEEIDKLVIEGRITEEIFAQTGYSDYEPKHYKFKKFLDRNEFADNMEKCDKVITHGGTGAIIGAVKKEKKVIGVPRLAKFGEHVDDHQIEIISQFEQMNIICSCINLEELGQKYKDIIECEFKKYYSNTKTIVNSIERFIDGEKK
mgnify:CR=1 FL=1